MAGHRRIVMHLVAIGVGAGAGVLAAQHGWPVARSAAADLASWARSQAVRLAAEHGSVFAAPLSRAPARAGASVPVPAPVSVARVSAQLVRAGRVIGSSNGAPVALADGSSFHVEVTPSHDGVIRVYAINPLGLRSDVPLWSAYARGGESSLSPRLRLAGTRGDETLRIELEPASQAGTPPIRVAQARLSIRHY